MPLLGQLTTLQRSKNLGSHKGYSLGMPNFSIRCDAKSGQIASTTDYPSQRKCP
jgi:hypothetical protein